MTMNEIKGKKFSVEKRGGYSAAEVDSFLREVCAYIDGLYNEKNDLLKKMEVLASKIEEYRQDEDSIQEALLGAQRLGRQVLNEAKDKAQTLEKASQEKADQMVSLATSESEKLINDSKKISQELLLKAKTESQRMINEAQEKADAVYRNTRYDIEKEQAKLSRMQKEVAAFKVQLLGMYQKHLDLIKDLPEEDHKEESNREVRSLNEKMYQEEVSAKEVAETDVLPAEPMKEESPAPAAEPVVEEGGTVEFQKVETTNEEKPVLTDTVELAKEHFTKKMSDLKFGSNNQ